MKALLALIDKTRRHFEEGGALHRARPVFRALENFLFSQPAVTRTAPHVRDPLDVKRFMIMVNLALLPCLALGVYFFGLRVLVMVAVSYAAGGLVEVVIACLRKEEINEGFLVTGMLFPLILPPTLPLWMVALGVMFGVLVGKELFGGTGRNLFNPALVGRAFLSISYAPAMSMKWLLPGGAWPGRLMEYADASTVDAVTGATPLSAAREGATADLANMFWGNVAGSVGETSAALIIVCGTFLCVARVANWRTVAGTIGSFALLAAILHAAHPARFGPPLWHLCAGGLLFGAFFMATDPVTSPATNGGKWVYGAIIGTAVLLIRNLTGYVEGVTFAILLGNIAAPTIDEVAVRLRLRRLRLAGQ